MTLRQQTKFRLFGLFGRFRYFGLSVYFPKHSILFKEACIQGIYEAANVRLLHALCRPGSHIFDVGANIGLMAIPLLKWAPDCTVHSFEPSPNSLPYLQRTLAESGMGDRWRLVPKAAGATSGRAEFSVSRPFEGAYDGMKSTGRVAESAQASVPVTTLDEEWKALVRAAVSVIKIDVEGAELEVLRGASECIKATRPAILLEWNAANVAAYRLDIEELLRVARGMDYALYAVPTLVPIRSGPELRAHMAFTESFLLLPTRDAAVAGG